MIVSKFILLLMLTLSIFSCKGRNLPDMTNHSYDKTLSNDEHIVVSDDSVITVRWWDIGEGGTADDIESECFYKTEDGKTLKEIRPLLNIIHPNEEYGHHQVERIVTYEGEYGQKVYLFFLRAKVGSNEFAHNIIALQIDDDSLVPAEIFDANNSYFSDISIKINGYD